LDILIAPKEEANAWQLIKEHSLGLQANGWSSLRWATIGRWCISTPQLC
jgi:hypothetical protein